MTANFATHKSTKYCRHCSSQVEVGAKFCGDCGTSAEMAINRAGVPGARKHVPSFAVPDTVSYAKLAEFERQKLTETTDDPIEFDGSNHSNNSSESKNSKIETAQAIAIQRSRTPSFAKQKKVVVPAELVDELKSLNTALLREQLFLIFHWCIFLAANLIGFVFSMKCYFQFHGDEVSKIMMALTPLTFINLVALASLSPIKGTRAEIARVKERIKFVKIKIEYRNIF
ncbi:MAG: zinc ribbon domain-containing protein [Cyanobacteria bacterium TGS_CYA1]|nr:zinc ribbon domain-containing protein [Cyanobacteria bacterium TGS_CYA1]